MDSKALRMDQFHLPLTLTICLPNTTWIFSVLQHDSSSKL